jgi:AAA domain
MRAGIEALAERELDSSQFIPRTNKARKLTMPAPFVQNAGELLTKHFDPIRWAINGMVPEGVALLVGPPKVGKSWLTLQFAIAISNGSNVWNGRAAEVAGEVLMLCLEDNDRRIQSRVKKLRAAGADIRIHKGSVEAVTAPDVSRLHFATDWPRMDKGGLEHLDTWLAAHPNTRMVIIDTLGRFRPPESGRGSAYQSDYAIGAALKPIADRHNVAIVLVHHTRKMAASDALDTVSGTQGLTGSVDAILVLKRERGQMDAALYVTGRDIEHEEDYALKFDARSCTWSALGTVHEATRTRERQQIIDFISRNGPSKPKDIAEGVGKKGPAVRRLLQKLFAEKDIRLEDGRYSLIHTSSNSGNKSHEGHSGDDGDTPVTFVTPVTDVTGVTTPCTAADYRAARDGEA